MNTPLPASFPAHGGVITGSILTPEEIAKMDQRIVWNRIVRPMKITLSQPPAFIGHNRTVLPRGPFDLPVKRDGDADAVTHRVA